MRAQWELDDHASRLLVVCHAPRFEALWLWYINDIVDSVFRKVGKVHVDV